MDMGAPTDKSAHKDKGAPVDMGVCGHKCTQKHEYTKGHKCNYGHECTCGNGCSYGLGHYGGIDVKYCSKKAMWCKMDRTCDKKGLEQSL